MKRRTGKHRTYSDDKLRSRRFVKARQAELKAQAAAAQKQAVLQRYGLALPKMPRR